MKVPDEPWGRGTFGNRGIQISRMDSTVIDWSSERVQEVDCVGGRRRYEKQAVAATGAPKMRPERLTAEDKAERLARIRPEPEREALVVGRMNNEGMGR